MIFGCQMKSCGAVLWFLSFLFSICNVHLFTGAVWTRIRSDLDISHPPCDCPSSIPHIPYASAQKKYKSLFPRLGANTLRLRHNPSQCLQEDTHCKSFVTVDVPVMQSDLRWDCDVCPPHGAPFRTGIKSHLLWGLWVLSQVLPCDAVAPVLPLGFIYEMAPAQAQHLYGISHCLQRLLWGASVTQQLSKCFLLFFL